MRKPRVDTNPVANMYSASNERIIDFYDPNTDKGGLIAFRVMGDGTLRVEPNRLDEGVEVVTPEHADRIARLTVARDRLREHVANLSDKQPWDNRAMFEETLAALEAATA